MPLFPRNTHSFLTGEWLTLGGLGRSPSSRGERDLAINGALFLSLSAAELCSDRGAQLELGRLFIGGRYCDGPRGLATLAVGSGKKCGIKAR